MPFTTSHPALILPLKKFSPTLFSLSGLMAGAMSPDLLYFLLMDTTDRGFSHSWLGLFVFCLPAGMAFAITFHYLVKRWLILSLPWPFTRIFAGLSDSRFELHSSRQWITLAISVLIGALSHFLWDSFTHVDGEVATMIPWLTESSVILGIERPNCRFLQHASSLFGAIFVPVYLVRAKLIPPVSGSLPDVSPVSKFTYWAGGILSGIVLAVVAVNFYDNHANYLATAGLAVWAGFFYWACVYSIVQARFQIRNLLS